MRREGSSYIIVRWWWWLMVMMTISSDGDDGDDDDDDNSIFHLNSSFQVFMMGTTVLSKQDTGFTTFVASISRLLNLSYNPKRLAWELQNDGAWDAKLPHLIEKRVNTERLGWKWPLPKKRWLTGAYGTNSLCRFKQFVFSFLHLTSSGKWFQSHVFLCSNFYRLTPPKTNIAPENMDGWNT